MKALLPLILLLFLAGSSPAGEGKSMDELVHETERAFAGQVPKQWGGNRIPGVHTRLATKEKAIALTFDACGGSRHGYDAALVDFLAAHSVQATLFVNERWIEQHPDTFRELAQNPLFEIENHGTAHRPLSVSGREAYGIKGTGSVAEVVREVEANARKIESITGRRPRFFRSGTAHYDEVAVRIANRLGHKIAGYTVLGDGGATYSSAQVKRALLSSKSGDIVILHMNRPKSGTADGVREGVAALRAKGFRFVTLSALGTE